MDDQTNYVMTKFVDTETKFDYLNYQYRKKQMKQMMKAMFTHQTVCMNGGSKEVLFQMTMIVNMIIQMIMMVMDEVKTNQFE